jgi:enterochelin esterase-like enzyme
MSPVSRRSFLAAGAGVVASMATGCDLNGSRAVGGRAATVTGSFVSEHRRGARTGWSLAYPPGHGDSDALPVVISLHGRGEDHRASFGQLGLADVLDRVSTAQPTWPFALASVDGGDHGYWHERADGTDSGAMVREEFVPLLRGRGLDTTRIGLYGWSMGGYGSLLLAGKERLPARGVAVSSPALFTSAGSTAPGAFDDADDFDRNDVYGHPEWLADRRVRLDCGTDDPFHEATVDFCTRLERVLRRPPVSAFPGGGHTPDYWHRMAYPAFQFLAAQLHRREDPQTR